MKKASEIYAEMCTSYADITGMTVKDGCDMAVRLYAAAAQLESLYVYNDWVKKQCFPQTAEGEYLDLHAEMRGLRRVEARPSMGTITFSAKSPVDAALEIPIGTVCMNAAGERFITLQSGRIQAGQRSAEIPARAVTAGEAGNVDAKTIVYMRQAPVGVASCVNEERFYDGRDREDDETLRKRILDNYKALPNGGNTAFYKQTAMSVEGVAAAVVIPKSRGVGTVDVIIAGESGMPSETLLSRVETLLSTRREICVDVQVSAPTAVTVDVTIELDIDEGYAYNAIAVQVNRAIAKLFDGGMLGRSVLIAEIGNIVYNIEGVKNYRITLPAADVEIDSDELPVLGTLSITPMDWS